jgi:ABC-type sugar transport system substrate-binding protein
MTLKKLIPAVAALVTVCSVGACDASGGAATGATPAQAKDIKQVTIGFAQRELDAPYYSEMVQLAQQIANKDGFKLLVQNANSDPVTQINQVNTMVAQGADLVLVDAVSPQSEKAQLAQAAQQKPLMFVDTPIPGVGFTGVQSDNQTIGNDAGKLLAQRMGSGATANMAILNGGPNDYIVGPDRQKGFISGLQSGGVKVNIVASTSGNYTTDAAVPATENMLSAHPDINVVLGLNDAMALGALRVLQNAKKTNVLVAASADGQKEALKDISDGKCTGQYVSTGLNSPSLAIDQALQIAEQVTTGKKKPSDFPPASYTKAAGIDCHDVSQYYDPNSVF